MKKFKLRDLDLYVGAALFTVLVLIIIVNVSLRYVFNTGLTWGRGADLDLICLGNLSGYCRIL
jgi:hypothetical protein